MPRRKQRINRHNREATRAYVDSVLEARLKAIQKEWNESFNTPLTFVEAGRLFGEFAKIDLKKCQEINKRWHL
jgi:hypothetical protein